MSDPALAVLCLPGRNYRGNPYFTLFCDGLENAGLAVRNIRDRRSLRFAFDILHIHFPEHFVTERPLSISLVTVPIFLLFLFIAKALGKTIVWTIHDVLPFNICREWLLWPYLHIVRWCVDGYVFMNPSSMAEFLRLFPSQATKPFSQIHHGPYNPRRLAKAERSQSRTNLVGDSNDLMVGFLGDIKRYKNIEALELIPRQTSTGQAIKLLIAGKVYPRAYDEELSSFWDVLGRDRVIRIDERLANDRIEELIQVVDLVFTPYTRGSNSGFAMLVLSCRGKIISSSLPMFKDLADLVGKPWICTWQQNGEQATLKELISEVTRYKDTEGDRNRLEQYFSEADFTKGGAELARFYLRCRAKSGDTVKKETASESTSAEHSPSSTIKRR